MENIFSLLLQSLWNFPSAGGFSLFTFIHAFYTLFPCWTCETDLQVVHRNCVQWRRPSHLPSVCWWLGGCCCHPGCWWWRWLNWTTSPPRRGPWPPPPLWICPSPSFSQLEMNGNFNFCVNIKCIFNSKVLHYTHCLIFAPLAKRCRSPEKQFCSKPPGF